MGQLFANLNEIDEAIKQYESRNFCQLWKRDARTLEAARRRVRKRVETVNTRLKYYSLKLSCKFGGKAPKQREKISRASSSFRQYCPFEIYLSLSQCGQKLEVVKVHDEHNHQISRELYNHFPRQRRLDGQNKEEVKEAIRLKANKKLIQQKIEQATGRPITMKDIQNLQTQTRKEHNSNELDAVVNFLQKDPNSTIEVTVDKDNEFKCLFYQDEKMKTIFAMFPELLMVDETYKLLDLKMPVYVLLAVDGHGLV